MKRILGVVSVLALIPTVLTAQIPDHSFGFGVEIGQLNAVQISYTPFTQFQTTAFIGSIFQQADDSELLVPANAGLTGKYFFSEGRSSGYVGLTSFVAYNRHYRYGFGAPLGMQHFVSDNVAFFGHITTAMTDDSNSLTLFAGFGVTFYMR